MVIQHNISAINSYRNLGINQDGLSKNLEKLSSGYRINRAGDDAAGLAISESMRSQINGLNQAASNAKDAIGLIQTMEGALTETHSMLQRLTTLATQSANGTYSTTARMNIQEEVKALIKEIDRIADSTNFNGIDPMKTNDKLAASSDFKDVKKTGAMTFQIGPTYAETISVAKADMTFSGIFKAIAFDGSTLGTLGLTGLINGNADEADAAGNLIKVLGGNIDSDAQLSGFTVAGQDYDINGTKNSAFTLTTQAAAKVALTAINAAIDYVSMYRAKLGAAQNRLEHTVNNLKVTSENIQAAESRIRDTDMADEITNYTKNNILLQAAQSMLTQANATPQGVLSMLG